MFRITEKGFIYGLILFFMTFVSCQSEDENRGSEDLPLAIVEAIQVEKGSLPLVQRLTGEMRARNQIEIYPEINARVTEVHVSDGDRVQEGDILVRLRDDDIREQLNQARFDHEIAQAQLRQAEASLRRLEAHFERIQQLADMDLETELELETIQADIDEAEATVDLAKAQRERAASQVEEQQSNLENTIVRAPINGVVGNRNAEIGQHVDSSTQLFQIGDIDNMRIFVSLTESMSNVIQPGDRAELVTESEDNRTEATVARISPFLDPVTHTTIAELEVDANNGNLSPGMFVTVDIYYGEAEESVIVPKSALYDHPIAGETGIYIADMEAMEMQFEVDEALLDEMQSSDPVTSNPVNVEFVPVDIIADGRGMAGISGVDLEYGWVVTVGQNQLAEWESEQAHIRVVDWDQVMELQNLQSRDMEELIFGNSGTN
jgi:HlyD family secretion protein